MSSLPGPSDRSASSNSRPSRAPASLPARTARELTRLGVTSDAVIVVAVSGGPDSMALLHVLAALRAERLFGDLIAAHVNHTLRSAESDRDEEIARTCCEHRGIPFECIAVDTAAEAAERHAGIEETARDIRYEFFDSTASKHSATHIVTAHTANDQAETLLMRLVRGAGVRGLAGIPERRETRSTTILRPWLGVTRDEIVTYVNEQRIPHGIDSTNEELLYQRNRVRHIVMPALVQAFPDRDPVVALARAARNLRQAEEYLRSEARRMLPLVADERGLCTRSLVELPQILRRDVLQEWLASCGVTYTISEDEAQRLEDLIHHEARTLELHRGIVLERADDRAAIRSSLSGAMPFDEFALQPGFNEIPAGTIEMKSVPRNEIELFRLTTQEACFDADLLQKSTLTVRPWREGDRMRPFGMHGHSKLVSDLLTDASVSSPIRECYPVVSYGTEASQEIVWIPGIRRSDAAPVNEWTQRVLHLRWHAKPLR